MIIYPKIHLLRGRAVTVGPNQEVRPTCFSATEMATKYAEDGAEWLHIVDLDAYAGRKEDNSWLVAKITANIPLPVQVDGRIRNMDDVHWWMDAGVDSVVIDSAALTEPEFIENAARDYPYRVLLGIEVCQGKLATGCGEQNLSPVTLVNQFDALPMSGVIIRETKFHLAAKRAGYARLEQMSRQLTSPVLVDGVVKTLDDLIYLSEMRVIAGVLIGQAIHDQAFGLREALTRLWGVDPDDAWWRTVPSLGERPDLL